MDQACSVENRTQEHQLVPRTDRFTSRGSLQTGHLVMLGAEGKGIFLLLLSGTNPILKKSVGCFSLNVLESRAFGTNWIACNVAPWITMNTVLLTHLSLLNQSKVSVGTLRSTYKFLAWHSLMSFLSQNRIVV